ncbi:MAG: class I SAM-dependent methyltransferase [Anaerolineales bacterium]|nr:class I SAM-dependent methyltransferase [Anaerolineales bacterium]
MADRELNLADFARLFGVVAEDISEDCCQLMAQSDFRYQTLDGNERDQVLLEVLKKIDAGQFSLAGKEGKARWEKGWSENLQDFRGCGHDVAGLVPKYIRPGLPLRLDQGYIQPVDSNFELNWYEIFRRWLFKNYLKDVETIYEFGCGSGFNLATLAQLYPEKKYWGLDWAAASVDIVNELARTYGWKMTGRHFDFFSPDTSLKFDVNSAVLTIGALEQTGQNYEAFLQYLLAASPRVCVHIEPIVEWYDENNLIDYAAIRFHKTRKYWEGFPDRLKALEAKGKVEILRTRRAFFGSLYLEGYSQVIWRTC